MKATLTDIAREVGVSKSLVSMYLNNHRLSAKIAAETKKKIDLAVERSGYRPSHAARTLAGGGSRILGMVVGGLTDPYFAHLADIAIGEAAAAGCQLLLGATRWDKTEELYALENLVRHDCAGVLHCPELDTESPFLEQLSRENYPLLLLNNWSPRYSTLYSDYTGAHRSLARFLAARRCPEMEICHIFAPPRVLEELGEFPEVEGCRFRLQPPVADFEALARHLLETRPPAIYVFHNELLAPILELLEGTSYRPILIIRCGPGYDFVRHPLIAGAIFSRASDAVRQGIRALAEWSKDGAPKTPVSLTLPATFRSAEEIPKKGKTNIVFRVQETVNQ